MPRSSRDARRMRSSLVVRRMDRALAAVVQLLRVGGGVRVVLVPSDWWSCIVPRSRSLRISIPIGSTHDVDIVSIVGLGTHGDVVAHPSPVGDVRNSHAERVQCKAQDPD